MIFKEEEDFSKARHLFAQALRSEEKTLGLGHPSLALTQAQLATMQFRLGEMEKAIRTAGEALAAVADQPEGSKFRKQVEHITAPILNPADTD